MAQEKRLFSHDPASGIRKYFVYEESDSGRESEDQCSIITEQDVSGLIANNRAFYDEHTSLTRWGEMSRVANIPLSLYYALKKLGKTDDDAYMRRWLNDPENRFFRTRPGRV